MKQLTDQGALSVKTGAAHREMMETLGTEQRRVVAAWLECLGDQQLAIMLETKLVSIADNKARAELFVQLIAAVETGKTTGHIF